jgi:DNA-binding transcriptional regulator GbsR (MarR family)
MKLTTRELTCLRAIVDLDQPCASGISGAVGLSRPDVSRVIAALQDKGFVTTKKTGLSKVAILSETKHAALGRKLILEFEHMPLEELLSGACLEVLAAVCSLTLTNRKEIAHVTLLSERSVASVLERLARVGVIQKAMAKYSVSPRFKTLEEFVIEYRHYLNESIGRDFARDAVVLWECNTEFIIESKTLQTKKGFQPTGASAFARFGVQLLAPSSYFFYSPSTRKLRLEDVILHSLLVHERSLLPTMLVWKKQEKAMNIRYLKIQAEKYGAPEPADAIIAYFASEGRQRSPDFPTWDEFALRAREYGIS